MFTLFTKKGKLKPQKDAPCYVAKSPKKETKDEIVSLRLSTKLKEFLIKDSKKKGLSLGVNIEKILADQQKWESFSRQIMLIEIFRELYVELLSNLSDKKLREVGKNNLAELLQSAIIFEHGKLTLENLFSIYERWIDYNYMHSKHIEIDNGHQFAFRHQLGVSFSKMTFESWKELTGRLGYKIKSREIGEALLVFDIVIPAKS